MTDILLRDSASHGYTRDEISFQEQVKINYWISLAIELYSRWSSLLEMGMDMSAAGPKAFCARWPYAVACTSAAEAVALSRITRPEEMLREHCPEGCPRELWLQIALQVTAA